MKTTIRFGIIGCGAIALWHLRAIEAVEGATLVAVMDENPMVSEAWGQQYGVKAYTNVEKLLQDDDVDAVCICTPSGLHATLGKLALEAGKHVVAEKPMAITAAETEALLQAEKTGGARLCPISQLRFIPDVLQAKQRIEQGQLGRILMVDLSMKYYRDPSYYTEKPWRGTWEMDGGGALMNQGIHGLDMLRFLCGDVSRVFARGGALCHAIETEDTLVANLELAEGGLAVVTAGTAVYPGCQRRLEICGTDGMLVMQEGRLVQLNLRDGTTLDGADKVGLSGCNDPASIDFEPHLWQYRDIVSALLGGGPLALTAADAAGTIRTILSIYESCKTQTQQTVE